MKKDHHEHVTGQGLPRNTSSSRPGAAMNSPARAVLGEEEPGLEQHLHDGDQVLLLTFTCTVRASLKRDQDTSIASTIVWSKSWHYGCLAFTITGRARVNRERDSSITSTTAATDCKAFTSRSSASMKRDQELHRFTSSSWRYGGLAFTTTSRAMVQRERDLSNTSTTGDTSITRGTRAGTEHHERDTGITSSNWHYELLGDEGPGHEHHEHYMG